MIKDEKKLETRSIKIKKPLIEYKKMQSLIYPKEVSFRLFFTQTAPADEK